MRKCSLSREPSEANDSDFKLEDVLSTLDREQARVKIRMELRRFGKPTTIIEGVKLNKKNLLELSRKMKKKLATGGTVDEDKILLQGDHREKAAKILQEEGFPESSIEIV